MSDAERTLKPGRLPLSLGAFPMPVHVGRHLQRRVSQVSREPCDLRARLQRSFRVRVAEGVEDALFTGRSNARHAGARHCRVEVATEQVRTGHVTRRAVAWKHKYVRRNRTTAGLVELRAARRDV